MLADTSIEKGRSLDLFKESFLIGVKNLEAEVVKGWRTEAGETPIPVDAEGQIFFTSPWPGSFHHPAAAVFNAAKERWTLSFFEAVNFGAFVGIPPHAAHLAAHHK